MSSVVDPQPENPAAEELVAYLDGELSPDECRRVEERLAADADYRQQLRDLDQAWEALDVLPSRKAGDDFARTTMELVTVAAQSEASVATAGAAGRKKRRTTMFAAAALAGVLGGFAAAQLLLPNSNRDLLRDLPVIQQVDALRQIENVEFLRRLAAEVPADRLMRDEAAIDARMAQLDESADDSIEARRAWIESLTDEEKVVLADQYKRFDDLKRITGEQDRLRKLEREIRDGGPALQRTLLAYDQWLSRLTAGQQEELRQAMLKTPIDKKADLVERNLRQDRQQLSKQLSAEDAEKLRSAIRRIAAERQAEILTNSRRRGDGDRGRRPDGALMIIARELRSDDERNRIREQIVGDLSPEARAHLESLSGGRRAAQLWRWIIDAMQSKVDPDELERFFAEKLNNEQREQLLGLPPNEMQTRLERLYYATELGYRDAAPFWAEFRDRGDGSTTRPGQERRGEGRPGDGPPQFRDGPPRDRGEFDGPPPGGPRFDGRGPEGRGPRRPGPGGPPPETI